MHGELGKVDYEEKKKMEEILGRLRRLDMEEEGEEGDDNVGNDFQNSKDPKLLSRWTNLSQIVLIKHSVLNGRERPFRTLCFINTF